MRIKKILFFTSPWCGPCKMIKPLVNEYVTKNLLVVDFIDVGEQYEIADEFHITKVPTLVTLIGGKEEVRYTGSDINKETLDSLVDL